ncbi:MAG: hypothetical protein KAU94_01370 [Verrucomicrobia bacterium]|nr:hypothetical protein [Verrucomicrobiota bacterium]
MKYLGAKKYRSVLLAIAVVGAARAGAEDLDRIQALEKQMAAANAEIVSLKNDQNERSDLFGLEEQVSKVRFGGYGEIHGNFVENGSSMMDIHRLVVYLGYDFTDWIRLSTEVELEHAYVTDGAGGEISIEQLYVDFLFGDAVNGRAGRILAPLGIINQYHEPTLFLGVERPGVDKYIIPTTWSLDGAGLFGSPLGWLSYQAYAVAGLEGSGFDGSNGVRKGRNKERSGLNDPAVTGRLDFFPFVDADLPADQDLRIGLSGYYGGTDNANKGGSGTPGVENTFAMASADFEYTVSRLRFRGVVAHGSNSDAAALNAAYATDAGDEIFGWYLEGGVSVMPESWKRGKLKEADLIPFVRYEEYDTQYKMPDGYAKLGENARTEITVGINFPLSSQFVLKADYQFRYNESDSDPNNVFNLGMGWVFQGRNTVFQ